MGGLGAVQRLRASAHWAMLGICVVALPFAVWGALGPAASITVPFGLPGMASHLALDPLSAFFAVPVLAIGAAVACARDGAAAQVMLPQLAAFIAAMLLTLLAADGFTLVVAFEAAAALAWSLTLSGKRAFRARASLLQIGTAVLGAVALVGTVALLAPPDFAIQNGLAFSAIRAAAPVGWRATLVLPLALLGTGGALGLVPLHAWLMPATALMSGEAGAVTSAAMTGVATYALARLLLDLAGAVTPAWWGVPFIALGGISAVLGALRANLEEDFKPILAAATVSSGGLIAAALGTALAARGTDLPALNASALGAALLLALLQGISRGSLFLCAGAVERAAGTQRLDRLGGLARAMPAVTVVVLVGAASLAAVPLSAGFAGVWLLLQALLLASRIEAPLLQITLTLAVAAVGLATGLGATAAVRLVGIAFLGRPRTPRAAAASEAPRRERLALAALTAVMAVLGLVPAAGLGLADAAVRSIAGVSVPKASVLAIGPQAAAAGYAPPGLLLLVALSAAGAVWWVRLRSPRRERRGPAWDDGGNAPPLWMPFGDPATEYSPASFAQPVLHAFSAVLLRRERLTPAPPGSARMARFSVLWQDATIAVLYRPAAVLARCLSARLAAAQRPGVRPMLALLLAVLIALLVATAALAALAAP